MEHLHYSTKTNFNHKNSFALELFNEQPSLELLISDELTTFYGLQDVIVTIALEDPEGDPVFYSLEYENQTDISLSVNYTLRFISTTTLEYTMKPANEGAQIGKHDIIFLYWDYYHQNDKKNMTRSFEVK
jgi:hypothetical protein